MSDQPPDRAGDPAWAPLLALTVPELEAELDRLGRRYLDHIAQFGPDTVRARALRHHLLKLETVLFLREQGRDN